MIAHKFEYPATKARREPRTNLFAMATAYTDAGSMPVKVRNLSPTGAFIEGAVLPNEGDQIRLCRGSLQVAGEVVWCNDRGAGVRFSSAVTVADWLPRGRSAAPQQRVDEFVHSMRNSPHLPSAVAADSPASSKPTPFDLMRITRDLEALAEDLASDPVVAERHALKLQVLDVAAQALRKLAAG